MATQNINNGGNGIGRCGEFLQYDFTADELAEFSQELARHTLERSRLEQAKKEVDSQFKSQIEAENTQITLLAGNISTKHERRMISCAILWHNPTPGRATICRIDTGEVVRERAMNFEELQERLPFEPPKPEPATAEAKGKPKRRAVKALIPEATPERQPVAALIEDGEIHDAEFTDVEVEKVASAETTERLPFDGEKTAGAGGAAD